MIGDEFCPRAIPLAGRPKLVLVVSMSRAMEIDIICMIWTAIPRDSGIKTAMVQMAVTIHQGVMFLHQSKNTIRKVEQDLSNVRVRYRREGKLVIGMDGKILPFRIIIT